MKNILQFPERLKATIAKSLRKKPNCGMVRSPLPPELRTREFVEADHELQRKINNWFEKHPHNEEDH